MGIDRRTMYTLKQVLLAVFYVLQNVLKKLKVAARGPQNQH